MLSIKPRNTDGTYGPTKKGKYYRPKSDHRPQHGNRDKHKWIINENQEFSVFEIAESPEKELFCIENDCYFSIANGAKTILGTQNERIAKFPRPKNESDAWHGYPVVCDHSYNMPSDALLDIMVKQSVISDTTRRRIERRKL